MEAIADVFQLLSQTLEDFSVLRTSPSLRVARKELCFLFAPVRVKSFVRNLTLQLNVLLWFVAFSRLQA